MALGPLLWPRAEGEAPEAPQEFSMVLEPLLGPRAEGRHLRYHGNFHGTWTQTKIDN